jgi:small conductance mechanosensitive channel
MATETSTTEAIDPAATLEQAVDVVEQLNEYGVLLANSLYVLIIGMAVIFVLHKLASIFLYPRIKNARLMRVIFGALYVLVFVITALLVLRSMGFEVRAVGQLALIGVLLGAVVIFFLVPFLPRLPFLLGHMVEISGTLGIVDAISTYHTTIRKFDGTVVFIPNALVMASKIMNFHDTPTRRIDLNLSISPDSDLEYTKDLVVRLLAEDDRVLDEPASPVVFVMSANAYSVDMVAYGWVLNEHWLGGRSDLWLKLMNAFGSEAKVSLAIPEQKVVLSGQNIAPG